MRKITLLLAFCTIFTFAKATVVIDETFNFSVANLASEATWTTTGTLTTGTGRNIEAGGLVYSNVGGAYINSAIGKKINQDYSAGTNYIAYKTFSTISSGVVYLSFLYQPNGDQGQTASEVLGLSSSTTNSAVKIWAGKQADGTKNPYRIGLTRSSTSSADIVWSTSTYSTSDVLLIVIKYDLTSYAATLFINPVIASASEPTPVAIAATDGTTRTSLINLMFKHNGSSVAKFFVSGVRVSTTWAEAVAVQSTASPLATPAVGSATSITANGFTAAWTQVANAIGYDVKVYLGANLVSTTNVSGQATESLAITGLMSGLTYSYKVIAKGDITNNSDSELSAASANVTTLDPYASNAIITDFGDASWGEVAETQPATGTYPTNTINGFDLNAAILYTTNGVAKGIKGESHTNRIAIDKAANGGKVTFPTVNSVEQIEIHATAGTAGNGFQLKEFDVATNAWSPIGGTYVYDANSKTAGTDSIYIIPISRSVPTKFRIENPTNGGIYLLQVITRTTNPALLAKPTVSPASGISSTGFTANWTAVANATAYKVFVYQGTSLIAGSPFTANGQATESLSITDLTAETAYSFKVQAIGDGDISFSDSFLSFAGLVTTSIGTSLDELSTSNFAIVSGKKISLVEAGSVNIYNLQGAQVYQAKNVNSMNTNLATGLYILRFTNNTGKQLIQKISIR